MRVSHEHDLREGTNTVIRAHGGGITSWRFVYCKACDQTWATELDPKHWNCEYEENEYDCDHYWVPALEGAECEWCGKEQQPTLEETYGVAK
jgi:hypothetical protein